MSQFGGPYLILGFESDWRLIRGMERDASQHPSQAYTVPHMFGNRSLGLTLPI